MERAVLLPDLPLGDKNPVDLPIPSEWFSKHLLIILHLRLISTGGRRSRRCILWQYLHDGDMLPPMRGSWHSLIRVHRDDGGKVPAWPAVVPSFWMETPDIGRRSGYEVLTDHFGLPLSGLVWGRTWVKWAFQLLRASRVILGRHRGQRSCRNWIPNSERHLLWSAPTRWSSAPLLSNKGFLAPDPSLGCTILTSGPAPPLGPCAF